MNAPFVLVFVILNSRMEVFGSTDDEFFEFCTFLQQLSGWSWLPTDPDLARRDLLDMKVMGFNAIRFIWGGAQQYQLDLCDEIGLLVYNESFASQGLDSSSVMFQRFDRSQLGMIHRDRNHPSVIIWGLLNETMDGPVFRHAVALLPRLRALDNSRLILLGSGRWDGQFSIGSISNPGSLDWEYFLGKEAPNASPSKMTKIGGYCESSGDAHVYPIVPQPEKATNLIRGLGQNSKPVFLSEYGIGSSVDLWRVTRHFERLGKEGLRMQNSTKINWINTW